MSIEATPFESDTGAEVGLKVFRGEPISLDWEREGDALESLVGPPPPLLEPTPPCDAAAATEEASWELEEDGIVLPRAEDSSWLPDCCCAPCEGEKGEDTEETEEVRLMFCRAVDCCDG
jgi:hypothetical protein